MAANIPTIFLFVFFYQIEIVQATVLDYIGQNLTAVPAADDQSPDATTLFLKNNRISTIPSGSLDPFDALVELYLDENNLNRIGNFSAIGDTLQVLSAEANDLTILHSDSFDTCYELTKVNLGTNHISIIQPGTFDGLILTILELSENQLEEFPDLSAIGGTLLILDLSNNVISSINPEYLDSLAVLQQLWLHINPLVTFPDVAGPRNTLKFLFLSMTDITEFPALDLIGSSLKVLKLNALHITSIPVERLIPLENLEELYIRDNKIGQLSNVTTVMSTLHTLDIRINPLMISPDDMATLSNLEELKLTLSANSQLYPFCKPAPQMSLTLQIQGSGFDMSSCEYLWLKQSQENGTAISITNDQFCVPGKTWASCTLQELRETCTAPPAINGKLFL